MLISLQLEQIAVIEKVTLEPEAGFLVLSGETGAGKSIIIDSINMALGERTSKDLIRRGADRAKVQALFDVEESVEEMLRDKGIETEDGQVLISRELHRDGRTICRINGELATVASVKTAAPFLLNIHGQHDNQILLQNSSHIDFIDRFAKNETERAQYREVYDEITATDKEIEQLQSIQEQAQLMDLYRYQIQEIEQAQLRIGEENEIRTQLKLLEHTEIISESVEQAYHELYGSDGAYDAISRVVDTLGKAVSYDPTLEPIYQTLEEAEMMMDDASHSLRTYAEGMDRDPQTLDLLQNRLKQILDLKRKYGKTEEDVLDYYQEILKKAEGFGTYEERLSELQQRREEQARLLESLAERLSETRRKAASLLERKIMEQLTQLDMGKMRFAVQFLPTEATGKGKEKASFLLASNPGEELKELSKIASGGELSRIMLALKSVLADADPAGTLIFDEIDVGVSGRAAQKIAEKLAELSKKKQVVCITHLPQIAAMADSHFLIEKQESEGRAVTHVTLLNRTLRLKELARMLGGVSVTELTVAAAEQMLEQAEEQKKRIE